jgi:glycosyltransferase involved in cell wall biosynthesis
MLPNGIMKIVRLFNPNAKMIFITPYKPVLPSVPRELAKLAQSFDIFDEIWVQAPDFADDLHSLGVNRSIVVLPYMTQTLPSPTDLPMGSFKIGFLGRLVEDKNVNLLLRSFQIVADQLPSIGGSDDVGQSELHIFGDGPLRSQLQQEAVELGVGAQVFFHGALPQREVQNAVASCHLFVFTSRVEGQCLAALEILAGGRPIVATAVGAFPEILSRSDFGGLVNKALPDPIAAEISKLARRLSSEELTIEQVHKTYQELFGPVKLGSRYESTLLKFRVHQ